MEDPEPQFMIIGAGISGLLLAQALQKIGIKCTVFERETSAEHSRPREWSMSIQWALPLLNEILPPTILERLKSVTVDPSFEPPDHGELPILNAETGELLKRIPLVKVYRVSRRKFRGLLSDGIDIQYGKSFKAYELEDSDRTIRALFEDGSQAIGSTLIATDGARSAGRIALLGLEKATVQTAPYSGVNLHVSYEDVSLARMLRQLNPIYTMGVHPLGYWLWMSIQDVPDPQDPKTWIFQLQCTWKFQPAEEVTSLLSLKKRAAVFADPFKSAFLATPEGTPLYENKMTYWIPQQWNSAAGRIVLSGDAAHPMTFHRGQGLNHCIADVAKFVKAIKNRRESSSDLSKATDEYMNEMIARAGDEVRLSLKNTEMLHNWAVLMQSPLMQQAAAPGASSGSDRA